MFQYPGATLPDADHNQVDLALVTLYAPRILFDRHEPFLPQAVGYTVFYADGYSPSFPRYIGLSPVGRLPAALAIEYAIWWDWDIQHLYELEHFWTFVDAEGVVIHAEGSWHGDFMTMHENGRPSLHKGTHPIVYAQPGKHALAPTSRPFWLMEQHTRRQCADPRRAGLWITPIFEHLLTPYKTAEADCLANAFLETQVFEPAFAWDQAFDITAELLLPWTMLANWIPHRIRWVLAQLQLAMQEK
ncbi:MAG: hypothetical protein ACE5E7_02965 [Anaerolineae bacterium]